MDSLTLTQLVFTRVSHDLSGITGAIYNGTELLQEDPSFIDEAGGLIQSSAADLMARMRFFRQTFGLPKESEDTTAMYLKTFSMPFELNGICANNLQRTLVMALTDYFYRGAVFEISDKGITARGAVLKNIAPLKEILLNETGEQSALNAPAFYAHSLLKEKGSNLKIDCDEKAHQISILFA